MPFFSGVSILLPPPRDRGLRICTHGGPPPLFVPPLLSRLSIVDAQVKWSHSCFIMQANNDPPMNEDVTPAPPVSPVLPLGKLVLNSAVSTTTLLQYLTLLPNALDAVDILGELSSRNFEDVLPYLKRLSSTHWHRHVLKKCLRKRLWVMSLPQIHALQEYFPHLSALYQDMENGQWYPIMGPLSDRDTAEWDLHDWYHQLIHAKRMEGQWALRCCIPLTWLPLIHLQFHS